MAFSTDSPWIKERETMLCSWKPDYNRGYINNMNVDLSVDWYCFSKRQMREYVRMIKSFGFTGIQLMDGCVNWSRAGSWEAYHDKLKEMACALHEEKMNCTLWVWAAMFSGHGWSDSSVVYDGKDGKKAYDTPEVFAVFDKYYEIYADMAEYCDRLILHFYDPGNLYDYNDVIRFSKLIENKFLLKNPKIKMGIDTWGAPDDFPKALVSAGLGNYMLMETSYIPAWGEGGKRAAFRKEIKKTGSKLGIWSWYAADMEIDQRATMIVNPKVIKDIYTRIRKEGDEILAPCYWSEMDSYHVLNLFSLYCSGQLLIDPERDPDELLKEIAYKVFGNKYGKTALEALQLIQEARCGDKWETYWWSYNEYVLKQKNTGDLAARATAVLEKMKIVASDDTVTAQIPLPVSPYTIANLMLPHIEQIRSYAVFRNGMKEVEKMLLEGADKEIISEKLKELSRPIPDFNAIIGVFGQPEACEQYLMLLDFSKRAGIPFDEDPLWKYTFKKRFYEYLVSMSKTSGGCDTFNSFYYEFGLPFGQEESRKIIKMLEDDGLVTVLENGDVKLNYSDVYKFGFVPDLQIH